VKAALIVNPLAGRYRENGLAKFTSGLEKFGVAALWHKLEKGQPAEEIVSGLDHRVTPLVILAAGDGTVNSAFNALVQRNDYEKFNVSIVPVGTANILSRELGIKSPRKSLEAIVSGKIKKLHMGKITATSEGKDRSGYFMLMASAGLDSLAVSCVNEKLKRKIGGFAYVYEFFRILLKKDFHHLEAQINGQLYSGVIICVSNGKYYGIELPIASAKIDESNFDVIVIKKITVISLIKYIFTKNSNNNIIRLTNINHIAMAGVVDNYPMQIDGDYCHNLPVNIESTDVYVNVYYL
jgi:diacylglycerol kinase family enzyme